MNSYKQTLKKRLKQGQREASRGKGKDLDLVMKELDALLSSP